LLLAPALASSDGARKFLASKISVLHWK